VASCWSGKLRSWWALQSSSQSEVERDERGESRVSEGESIGAVQFELVGGPEELDSTDVLLRLGLFRAGFGIPLLRREDLYGLLAEYEQQGMKAEKHTADECAGVCLSTAGPSRPPSRRAVKSDSHGMRFTQTPSALCLLLAVLPNARPFSRPPHSQSSWARNRYTFGLAGFAFCKRPEVFE
jgi:hypothetical protein